MSDLASGRFPLGIVMQGMTENFIKKLVNVMKNKRNT
jgi:hypothetical protein